MPGLLLSSRAGFRVRLTVGAYEVVQSGYGAVAIHGDKTQGEREAGLRDFVKGTAPVMFATDVPSAFLPSRRLDPSSEVIPKTLSS